MKWVTVICVVLGMVLMATPVQADGWQPAMYVHSPYPVRACVKTNVRTSCMPYYGKSYTWSPYMSRGEHVVDYFPKAFTRFGFRY